MPGLVSEDLADTNYEIEVGMSWAVFWNFLGKFIDNPNAILRSSNVFSGPASKGGPTLHQGKRKHGKPCFWNDDTNHCIYRSGFSSIVRPMGIGMGPF